MSGRDFSLKARRSTRIPMRIPIRLGIQTEGASVRSLDAWTLVLNRHGARIECKVPLALNQEVLLTVSATEMSSKGKVVWRELNPNQSGNYECTVELLKPENLWGVEFPPTDWTSQRRAASEEAAEPSKEAAEPSKEAAEPSKEAAEPSEEAAEPSEEAAEPEVIPVSWQSDALETSPESQAVHEEVVAQWAGGERIAVTAPYLDLTAELSQAQPPPPNLELGKGLLSTEEATVAKPGPASPEIPASEHPPPSVPQSSSPPPGASTAEREQSYASNRLVEILNDLVESALETRVQTVGRRLGTEVERQYAEVRTAALANLQEAIQDSVSSHGELLGMRAIDIVTHNQQLLEQNIQEFLRSTEQNTKVRQQELCERLREGMQNEMLELVLSSKGRLQQEAADLVSGTRSNLRHSILQELPAIENEFAEQCRARAERLLSARLEETSRLLSDRVQQASENLDQLLGHRFEQIADRLAATLERRSEQILTDSVAGLEQRLMETGSRVAQSFLQHIVTEIKQRQEQWIQQAHRSLEEVAEQNLQRTRQGFSRMIAEWAQTMASKAEGS
jgi:hypothetical protein